MAFEPSISFIGAGNLAWHLAPALDNSGYAVKEVFSRSSKHASDLIDRLYEAERKDSLDFSDSDSRIFILAVSDNAIADVSREIVLPDESLLIHTSGSVSLDTLGFAASTASGVFYPLQSFTKNRKIEFKGLPIFVEGSEPDAEEVLFEMGRAMGGNIQKLDSEKRLILHLAAVFASNFSNHMLAISNQLADQNQIRWEWLKPLIRETIEKSLAMGPLQAQTGPAKRGDFETIDKHLAFLQNDEVLASLYRALSQHIADTHQAE